MADHTVRQRLCLECGHRWYTVEVVVANTTIGWEALQRKPVLRETVQVEVMGVERIKAGRPVTDCEP